MIYKNFYMKIYTVPINNIDICHLSIHKSSYIEKTGMFWVLTHIKTEYYVHNDINVNASIFIYVIHLFIFLEISYLAYIESLIIKKIKL